MLPSCCIFHDRLTSNQESWFRQRGRSATSTADAAEAPVRGRTWRRSRAGCGGDADGDDLLPSSAGGRGSEVATGVDGCESRGSIFIPYGPSLFAMLASTPSDAAWTDESHRTSLRRSERYVEDLVPLRYMCTRQMCNLHVAC